MTYYLNDNNNNNNTEILFSMNEMNTIMDINNNVTITNITKAYDNNETDNISTYSENDKEKEENSKSKYDIDLNNENLNVYKFKIILLGDVGVGKTAIFQRFITNKFSIDYHCTINCEYKVHSIKLNNNALVKLNLWDTAGTEKFQSVTRSYYKNSNGIVLIFDLTSRKSFNQLKKWVNEINDYCPKESEIILVGNKSDCNNRTIEKEEAQLFAKKNNYDYIETSALNGTNVLLLFETLSKKLVEKENNNESLDNTKTSLFNNRKSLNNYYRSNSLNADKFIQRRNNKNKNITKKKDKSSCC